MGLVTTFCPLMTNEAVELVCQTVGGTRLVANSKVKPVKLAGHVTITLVPERIIVSCGDNEILNTVPEPKIAPYCVVPYRVLPDKIRLPEGLYPTLLVSVPLLESYATPPGKVISTVKLLPFVLSLNTVPDVVPYNVLPDKIKLAAGLAPSLLVKLCRVVKPVPLVLMANTVPAPPLPPRSEEHTSELQ